MFTAAGDDVTSQQNVTSMVDTALSLQCPLVATERGSLRTAWQKRDDDGSWRLLPRDGDRIRVRPGDAGDLEFDRLLVSDAGFYRCSKTAARGVDEYSTPVVLTVHGMARKRNVAIKFSTSIAISVSVCRLFVYYPHMPIDKVRIYRLLCVCMCVFVRLRISPPASNFARRFIGVQGRKSHIFVNFAPQKPKTRRIGERDGRARRGVNITVEMRRRKRHARDAPFVKSRGVWT